MFFYIRVKPACFSLNLKRITGDFFDILLYNTRKIHQVIHFTLYIKFKNKNKMEPDQRLEKLDRLPTGFFPSPKPEPATVTDNSKHYHKPRVVVVAYDHSNYSDAMIAKSIRNGTLRPTDDIRILHIVNQSDYRTLFSPMISGAGTTGNHDHHLDSTLENAADAFIYEIINVLRKKGVSSLANKQI
jgi:hypothetical protein